MKHYTLQGPHYEMGCCHGASLLTQGEYILNHVPFPVTGQRVSFAQACIPLYEKWFPAILQELRGLADGQRCDFNTLAGVLLPMYCLPPQPHCSCFAVRRGGQILLGRNSDFLKALKAFNACCLCRPEGRHAFWGNTTAFIEMEDGVNDTGLAVGLTSVYPPAPPRPGLNAGLLLRLILETCTGVGEALELLRQVPAASSHTLILADRTGEIALAECCGEAMAVRQYQTGNAFVCAVNAFNLPEMAPYVREPDDSWMAETRYAVMTRALASGVPDAEAAMDLLSGKQGFLCQYDSAFIGDTVWSAVYDLSGGVTWLAEDNPVRTDYRIVPEAGFVQQKP